jgi:hypothetical protein
MRLAAVCLIALASVTTAAVAAGSRPHAPSHAAAVSGASSNQPPHAWLFGSWTGGLFPVLDGMVAQDCRTQPTVVFSKDAVGHASLLGTGLTQRVIVTVRATPKGAEFTFAPADAGPRFGCPNEDELQVVRASPNEISFPNCTAFPYPLERCGG